MLKLENINKSYGEKQIFSGFNASFRLGKVSAILGNSGQGKTTLLNVVAGLTEFSGKVTPNFEMVSYVFQGARLIENLTLLQNVEYVLQNQIPNKTERKNHALYWLSLAEISHLKNKYPSQISGGEAQRVQLARAFSYKSDLLIMDEPFSSLDIGLKSRLIDLYTAFLQKSPKTVLFVTHNVIEATDFADDIYVLGKNSIIKVSFDKEDQLSRLSAQNEIYKILKG